MKLRRAFFDASTKSSRLHFELVSVSPAYNPPRTFACALVILGLCLLWGHRAAAQNAASSAGAIPTTTNAAGATVPDISGFWELRYDSENVPPASLTAAASSDDKTARYLKDMATLRWCNKVGVPYSMGGPAPLDIREGRIETAIISQAVSPARHIYTNAQTHPDMATFDATANGHSIGHWEGDTLIVDTVGFSDDSITTIPGGGYRTPDSHLVERYRLLDGGQKLSVTFTWEDPKVYAKPHSYQFVYYRAPAGYYAREFFCDATDAERAKLLTDSPEK